MAVDPIFQQMVQQARQDEDDAHAPTHLYDTNRGVALGMETTPEGDYFMIPRADGFMDRIARRDLAYVRPRRGPVRESAPPAPRPRNEMQRFLGDAWRAASTGSWLPAFLFDDPGEAPELRVLEAHDLENPNRRDITGATLPQHVDRVRRRSQRIRELDQLSRDMQTAAHTDWRYNFPAAAYGIEAIWNNVLQYADTRPRLDRPQHGTPGSPEARSVRIEQEDENLRDPWHAGNPMNPARWGHGVAAALGTFAGGMSDPLNLIAPEEGMVSPVGFFGRMGFQGLWGGITDVGDQEQRGALDVVMDDIDEHGRRVGTVRMSPAEYNLWLEKSVAEARQTGGDAAVIDMLDLHTLVNAPREAPHGFDLQELATSMAGSALMQGAFDVGGHGLKWAADRAMRGVTAPLAPHLTRMRIRSLGDPALDRLARRPDGTIDPNALGMAAMLEHTDPRAREMLPAIEKLTISGDADERVSAAAELLVRAQEAQAQGYDLSEVHNAITAAIKDGSAPDLHGFRAAQEILRGVGEGRLMPNEFAESQFAFADILRRAGDKRAARVAAGKPLEREVAQAAVKMHFGEDGRPYLNDEGRAFVDNAAEVLKKTAELRSLSGFVRDEGGVQRGEGGETDMLGDLAHDAGKSLEDLAKAAARAGYFDLPPLPDALLKAILDDENGAKIYPRPTDPAKAKEQAEAVAARDYLAQRGVDTALAGDPEAIRREIADKVLRANYSAANQGPATPRETPPGWGMRAGSKLSGGGGAQLSPVERMRQYHSPVGRQGWLAKQGRKLKRKGPTLYVRDAFNDAYTMFIESQHPLVLAQQKAIDAIAQATGAPVDLIPSADSVLLARMSRDSYGPAHLDLVDGVRAYRDPNKVVAPSLREGIEKAMGGREWVDKRVEDFELYLEARRAVKEWPRFLNGDLPRPPHAMGAADLADVVTALEADNPQFVDAAQMIYAFLNAQWDKKRDAGLITDEMHAAGLANHEDYVPYQRNMDDAGVEDAAQPKSGDRTNRAKLVKRFRGSDRKIISPLDSIMQDTYDTADRIARNETYRALVDLADRAGDVGKEIMVEAPRAMQKTMIDIAEEAAAALRALGAAPQDVQAFKGSIDARLNGQTSRVIYRAGDVIEGGRHIIYVWRGGKRTAYELTDPEFAADLFKSLTGLTQEARDMFVDMVSVPTQALRTAITMSPGFQVANILRDSLSAWMLTDVGYKPGEALYGAAQVLGERLGVTSGDMVKLYNAVGTQGGGMVRAALPRVRLERDLGALRGKVLRMRNFDPRHGVATLWRGFEAATELSENASRLRIFARGYERAKMRGLSDYDAALWAGYESRDYLDFQRSGSKLLNARRLFLFMNVALQGIDRTLRTGTAEGDLKTMLRPIGNMMRGKRWMDGLTSDQRYQTARAYKLWVKMSLLAVFSTMLTALNADDEDYQYGFPDYIKNNYWLMRAGGDTWVAIPKPFDLAVFANMAERAYESGHGDPMAMDRLVWGLGDTLLPPAEITAAVVPLQLLNNRTATGAPIVPPGLQDLDPHLQASAFTSQVAVDFANAVYTNTGLEVSPLQIDHVLRGTLADFFRAPAMAVQSANPDAPATNASDWPVIGRFLREPGRGGTPVRDRFYEDVGHSAAALQRAQGTLQELLERGDQAGLQHFMETRPEFERTWALLTTGDFDTDIQRLHPMRRARDITVEIARIKREMNGARPGSDESYRLPPLSARGKRDAIERLDDLAAAEMQAAMVMSGAPGFAGREPMDVTSRYQALEAVSPGVYALLRARLASGRDRAYDYATVRDAWPEVRAAIQSQGYRANLSRLGRRAARDFGYLRTYRSDLDRLGGETLRPRDLRSREEDARDALDR